VFISQMRRRIVIAVAVVTAVVAGATTFASGATTSGVTVHDGNDTPVLLDLQKVVLTPSKTRVEAKISTYEAWGTPVLLGDASSAPGSFCVLIWTAKVTDGPASFDVCATVRAGGGSLTASVFAERSGGGTLRRVAGASVSRPSTRTISIRFDLADVGTPKSLRFAVEAAQQAGCPGPRGCVDRAPNGARKTRLTLG